MKTWEEFCKYGFSRHKTDFWGCVKPDGEWFDSSESFDIAIYWCCYEYGQMHLSDEQKLEWFETEGKRLGLSIIHSSMLKQMYERGLLK